MLKPILVRHPLNKALILLLQGISLGLLVLLLAGCSYEAVEVQQEQASSLAGELLDGHTLGQTLTLQHDGLNRIDLYTATYARENTQPIIFRISPSPGGENGIWEGDEMVHLELPAAQISNSGPTVITFPPVVGIAGQTLYFSIESPNSIPGDAITVYREEGDVYSGGQMYVDDQPTDGDMAFIAYTQETFTLADIWYDFYSRASQDRPFFIFYCSLMAILLLLLIVGLVWSSRRRGEDEPAEPAELVSKEKE